MSETITRAQTGEGSAGHAASRTQGPEGAASVCGAPSILVVDDEPGIRLAVSQVLTDEGYAVTAMHDVASATAAMGAARFAAILTDLRMPGLPGLALVDEVQRRALPIPVILMSGSLADLDRSDPRLGRVAGMLAKPVRLQALCSLVSEVIGSSR